MNRLKLGAFVLMVITSAVLRTAGTAFADGNADDPGHVHGIVTDVNYSRGRLELRSDQGKRYVLHVMPSTTISSSHHDADDYHALIDIHRGSIVDINMSLRNNRYEAQTIDLDNH